MDLPDQRAEPPAAEHAPAAEDARSHVREDGTLVINILVDSPCGQSIEGEIVVCATGEADPRLDSKDPSPNEPAPLEFQLAPNLTAGPRTEGGRDGEVRVMMDLTLKF